MNHAPESDTANESSSPHLHGQLGIMRTLVSLFGAPTAWVAQIILSEPVAAYACYPFQAPLAHPIWEETSAILAAINIACLIAVVLSDYIAWTSWRQITHDKSLNSINNGGSSAARSRFLVKLGLMSSFIFTAAVMFNIFAVFLVPLCSPWY